MGKVFLVRGGLGWVLGNCTLGYFLLLKYFLDSHRLVTSSKSNTVLGQGQLCVCGVVHVTGQRVNILGFIDHMVPAAAIQFCILNQWESYTINVAVF